MANILGMSDLVVKIVLGKGVVQEWATDEEMVQLHKEATKRQGTAILAETPVADARPRKRREPNP